MVFLLGVDDLITRVNGWLPGSKGLTVVEYRQESITDPPSPLYPPDPNPDRYNPESNTDRVDLHIKLINNTDHTIVLERLEFDFSANGVIPAGMARTAKLEPSGEYSLIVPDLQPEETASRYMRTPHALKPSDADYLVAKLFLPVNVTVTGEYSITARLLTSDGTIEFDSFTVPVLSDRVPVIQQP